MASSPIPSTRKRRARWRRTRRPFYVVLSDDELREIADAPPEAVSATLSP